MDTIKCPKCGEEIKLTESLAAPLVAEVRRDYEQRLADQESSILQREKAVEESERKVQERVSQAVESEREKIRDLVRNEERSAMEFQAAQSARQLEDVREQLRQREEKLAEAQAAQAEALRKERELNDRARELDLTVERRINEQLNEVRAQARVEAQEGEKVKLAEKEETIASLQRKIEDLKQRAEQGSQQAQGEAQEIVLETELRACFDMDTIEPVPKGVHGGDVLHRINGPRGVAGTILWESKRTKTWSPGWLVKLRDDQRAAGADIAIILTQTLPQDIEYFDIIDGVWVVGHSVYLPVAGLIRQYLLELDAARAAKEGQGTKMEMVYEYLTGTQFRMRVEAIIEGFSTMKSDLEKERRAITKQWAKRDAQLERVMLATTGMYGDLQGIAGRSLGELNGLKLPVSALGPGESKFGSALRDGENSDG